jgi:hypothetical protein
VYAGVCQHAPAAQETPLPALLSLVFMMLQQQVPTSSSGDAADAPATPASQAGSTTPASVCSLQDDTPCSSSVLSTGCSTAPFALGSCRSSALLHRGKRSSMLHAAALPGHQLCREAPASRSLLLHRMSKARQRAFLAYTEQMAKYYAEVDEFELIEESPGAPTATKARTRTRPQGERTLLLCTQCTLQSLSAHACL